MDIKKQFIETIPVERQAFYWVGLFYFLSKEAIDDYGIKGEGVIRQAIRDYGKERGERRRAIVDSKGLEPNLVSLFTNPDLPGDDRFESDIENNVLNEEERRHFVLRCPDAEMWDTLGGLKIGAIYCEEIHHYLYGCFDEAVQVNLCETLTNGGNQCRFYINCRKSNRKETHKHPYVPKSWEVTDSDGIASNYNAFCLFYCHLAKGINDKLGKETLIKGIRAFARHRGARLKELNRRANIENDIKTLIEQGDIFLDPRFDMQNKMLTSDEAHIDVHRCVFAEVCKDHGCSDLGQLFCEESYKNICNQYNPNIEVLVSKTLNGKANHCCINMKIGRK